jgi:hypothetical protein
MNDSSLVSGLSLTSAMLAAGITFGIGYFAALSWTVTLTGSGRTRMPAALTLLRLAGAAIFLGLSARLGAVPLLAAFIGFLLARALALHAQQRAD